MAKVSTTSARTFCNYVKNLSGVGAKNQQYYDDLAKIWDQGVSYYNPRTGNTLYTSAKSTHIFSGKLPTSGPITYYNQIGNAREQLLISHDPALRFIKVTRRKPNNFGIMNFLTTSNSITTRYYKSSNGGLYSMRMG